MGKLLKRAVWMVVCVVVVFTAAVVSQAIRAKHDMDGLVAEMQTLLHSNSQEWPLAIAKEQWGSRFRPYFPCTEHECGYKLVFSNRQPLIGRFLPYTEATAWFGTQDNRIAYIALQYRTIRSNGTSSVAHVQIDPCDAPCDPGFYLHPHGYSTDTKNGNIQVNRGASNEQKIAALEINSSCFRTLNGCSDISEMFPRIWKHLGTNQVASRLKSQSDANWDRISP